MGTVVCVRVGGTLTTVALPNIRCGNEHPQAFIASYLQSPVSSLQYEVTNNSEIFPRFLASELIALDADIW